MQKPIPIPLYQLSDICRFINEKYGYDLDFFDFIQNGEMDNNSIYDFKWMNLNIIEDLLAAGLYRNFEVSDFQEIKEYYSAIVHEFGKYFKAEVSW